MTALRNRQNLRDKFSTFMDLEDTIIRWQQDSKLRRSIEQKIASDPKANENYLAIYWLKKSIQSCPLAKHHLCAYLEETCYWVSHKICQDFRAENLNLRDCISCAREFTFKPQKFLKTYDSKRSKITTFVALKLRTYILKEIRRSNEEDRYSSCAFLRILNPTRITEALRNNGINQTDLYLLAWTSFNAIYVPKTPSNSRKLLPPTPEKWQEITCYYNQRCSEFNLERISVSTLQKLLDTIIKVCRKKIKTISIEKILNTEESSNFISAIPEENEISEELETKLMNFNSIISKIFQPDSFSNEIQICITLCLGLDFNQGDAGNLVSWPQYKVSREIRKQLKILFEQLVNQLLVTPNTSLTISEFDQVFEALEIWIKSHYQAQCCQFLDNILAQEINSKSFQIIELLYGVKLDLDEIAKQLNMYSDAVNTHLEQIKQSLKDCLKTYLENSLNTSFDLLPIADKQLLNFVEQFLTNAPYAIYKQQRKDDENS